MRQNPRVIRTSAIRALLSEPLLNLILWRVDQGTKLNTAVKLTAPHVSSVTAIKLVHAYRELQEALDREDILLASTIRDSLFPAWVQQDTPQPKAAVYYGRFPYGYWLDDYDYDQEITNNDNS